ncbi:DNA circularization N-terminal domain-containing protein [Bradyrhizobium sp. WSM 4400]|nr:DNA circularization N-terminal domain-containing protein [Bradyrhizobium australafricanum]
MVRPAHACVLRRRALSLRESGRRIVEHEFPKKELPYAEDMGRQAREFNVRGYCIVYPSDSEILLFRRDYRQARNLLIDVLEDERPGVLQLPIQPPQLVVCSRYRITEEERFGGYCAFVHDVPRIRHRSAALGAIRRHGGRADQRQREHARPGAARSVAGVHHRSGGRSMNRQVPSEAAALVDRMLENLIATVPPKGQGGVRGTHRHRRHPRQCDEARRCRRTRPAARSLPQHNAPFRRDAAAD